MATPIDEAILQFLREHPHSTARDMEAALGFEKKQINSRLYGALKGQVTQDAKYRWSLVGAQPTAEEVEKTPEYPNTPLSRLARYYLACISQDDEGVSVFAQSRYDTDYRELAALPAPGTDFWATHEARALLGRLRKDKSRLMLYLGYPTLLGLQKSSRSKWEGFMVEPLFLFPVSFDNNAQPQLDLTYPVVNRKAYKRVTNASGMEVMEELAQLESELGLDDVEVAPDLDDLVQRLRDLREEWPWRETIDPHHLSATPPLGEATEAGIYNRAVLVVAERSPFTQGLESELNLLARLPSGAADGTALAAWIAGPGDKADEPAAKEALLEVLPMNAEQRAAVHSALTKPLTIITGPPGTGKSQVVTNLLINAAWLGQRVLFASKNNKAVDVVESRVNNIGPRPVLLRVGSNQYQGRLAEYLVSLMSATASEEDRLAYQECQELHRQLVETDRAISKEAVALVDLRNRVDALEQQVETARNAFGEALFAHLREIDVASLNGPVTALLKALARADKGRQPWLVRTGWGLLAKSRYAALEQAAARLDEKDGLPGLKKPAGTPDDSTIQSWLEFGSALAKRLEMATAASNYFHALAQLQKARSLEAISREQATIIRKMAGNAERLWNSWLRLQPDRLSSGDRNLINRYSGLLKMVIDSGDGQLGGSVYRQYYQLFPQVGHLLPCWAVTSLSAKGRIPFEPGHFDLVVFDEASQCDIASALPLLYRAKRVAVIGDPKQLSHISGLARGQDQQLLERFGLLSDYPHWAYSYNSLFSLGSGMADSREIVDLRDHHRSHADIIEFSNQAFYSGRLRVATRYGHLKRPIPDAPGVSWVDVKGKVVRPTGGGAINEAEARRIVEVLHDLVVTKGYEGSIGVVSPFRGHANRIRQLVNESHALSDRLVTHGFLVDTVHKFQGDERDVMVFSPVVSHDTPRTALGFLDTNGNLFNVAITRARAQLIVVGDRQACATSGIGYLEQFARYVVDLEEKERKEAELAFSELGSEYPEVSNPEQVSDWEHVLYRALYQAGIRAIPQYRLEKYALDFALFDGERRLDIEVDGERYHRNWSGELCRRDQLRNQRLYELGWDVMRFWVYEIRDDLDGCVARINKWLEGGQ